MKRIASQAVAATLLFTCVYLARATTVLYDVTNISGNTWEYSYAINNNTLSIDIEEFALRFDLGFYENLVATSTPAGWDPLVIEPDPVIPDDGFYDALALSAGIAPGESLGGFNVQFDYLGAGVPGVQFFDIVDPNTFGSLGDGFTQLVPVPAAIWLFGTGLVSLLGVGVARHRKTEQ